MGKVSCLQLREENDFEMGLNGFAKQSEIC